MNQPIHYEEDLYLWFNHHANLLRAGQLSVLDTIHLADELEDMGISQLRALESRLTVLLTHLLKWQFQVAKRGVSWRNTIIEQRKQIRKLINRSPSLNSKFTDMIADAYDSARRYAETETGLAINNFPLECPYNLEQIKNDEFWPT
jgi:hypothetical protein